jgi:hypothetical protein
MGFLARLYRRRIVNVNANIIIAGLMAMAITVSVMHLADSSGLLATLGRRVPDFQFSIFGRSHRLIGQKLVISGLTFLVDVVSDVAVYYGLHFVANHLPRKFGFVATGAHAHLSFVRDATLVQFERAVLSPLLYTVALTTQNTLLHQGWSVEAATAIGLGTGIALTRCIHTLWMIQVERRAAARTKTAEAAAAVERARREERSRQKASA